MNIAELENKIFEDWNDNFIVKDGIVNFDNFSKLKSKVLVLLKETNDYVNDEQDLRIFLSQGGIGATWNNIARWVYGLQNIEKDTNRIWEEMNYITSTQRKEILNSLSSINLKKNLVELLQLKKSWSRKRKII